MRFSDGGEQKDLSSGGTRIYHPATVRLGALSCMADLPAGRPSYPLPVHVLRISRPTSFSRTLADATLSFALGFLLTGSLETFTPDDASCPAYQRLREGCLPQSPPFPVPVLPGGRRSALPRLPHPSHVHPAPIAFRVPPRHGAFMGYAPLISPSSSLRAEKRDSHPPPGSRCNSVQCTDKRQYPCGEYRSPGQTACPCMAHPPGNRTKSSGDRTKRHPVADGIRIPNSPRAEQMREGRSQDIAPRPVGPRHSESEAPSRRPQRRSEALPALASRSLSIRLQIERLAPFLEIPWFCTVHVKPLGLGLQRPV